MRLIGAQPDFAAEVSVNGPMLENLLDGLKKTGAPLKRVVLYQGAKVYGVHLGPVLAPFYENEIRHIPPNFYYTQEDTLRRRAAAGEFDWSILRPDIVIGDVGRQSDEHGHGHRRLRGDQQGDGNALPLPWIAQGLRPCLGPVHGRTTAGACQPVERDGRDRQQRGLQLRS